MNTENMKKLGKRIPLIGREKEIEQLKTYLHAPGNGRHYVYFWAHGGLGKTRLLEELERIVKEAGPRFYFSGIIDLYHTDTHSTSDLERIIVNGLDPQQKYFADYRKERRDYELLRERGTDPGILEERRKKLGDLFVQGCKEMAERADKLVICFDTIELLQYESSIVEEKAGLDIADTRVKPWLLEKLAQLWNVLVVFVGRPKQATPDELVDPQARLLADMEQAFGEDLTVVELQPFTFDETQAFLQFFEDEAEQALVPNEYLKIIHRLTGGQPIFLHLIVDWLAVLALESRTILQLFDKYMSLADVDENDEHLKAARQEIEREILNAIFSQSGEIGGYLTNIALMPKGVDAKILNVTLGLPVEEATKLLASLEPLSFIKHYKSPPGIASSLAEHFFLHDEVYRLLTARNIIPYLRMNERKIANTLVQNFYNPRIAGLEEQLAKSGAEVRLPLREPLQKLQVDRVYYLLVIDPRQGYEEYKRLTDYANRHRWVGFGMRLLDEFLRFYNSSAPERRKLFEDFGIANEQIIRESAWMWVERFDWWSQEEKEIQLAEYILANPETFLIICPDDAPICSDHDLAIMGNIYAFWTGARARQHGYELITVEKALAMLARLPSLAECKSEQALARARLATAIGFQYRLGGLLDQAITHYVDGKAAFYKLEKLEDYYEEYTLLLQSLAIVYAKQGRMALARPLAHEALRINEEIGSEYSTGLTLNTLSSIAQMRGNYPQALAYGEEALAIFREQSDIRGIALAYLAIARARRWMAKHEMEKDRKSKLEDARKMLEESHDALENALKDAEKVSIGSVLPELHAELGRVYRELALCSMRLKSQEKGFGHYRQAEQQIRSALDLAKWGVIDRANTLHDLAEILFELNDRATAQATLDQIEELIGPAHRIIPGQQIPEANLPYDYFAPLGKVELLKGANAFKEGLLTDGIKHYVLAYAYFVHFSADAVESDNMVEYLYNYMRSIPVDRQREVLDEVHAWVERTDVGVDVRGFVQNIVSLLGV